MAATAAIGSCFSTTTNAYIRSKNISPSDIAYRIARLTILPIRTLAYSHPLDPFSISVSSQKWRILRTCAGVVQEEAAAAIETESDEKEKEEEKEEEEQVSVEGEAAPLNTKLYFGNLPYNCDSAQLAGIIQEYGSPEMVEVLYDRDTGRSRGFAFVTMSSIQDANAVIQNLDGSEYGGRTLRVNFSDKPKPKEPLYPESEYKLFVGNLSWSVTSESLTQMCQEYGNVVGARVLYDGDTGRSRGYGFVCYSSQQEMDVALQTLNGAELDGRAMRVSPALGKKS
ncbi:RNA-binding (RRM/RBD/RNP motifs) family protein [Tasmannia lanceolata]|uniref:RNA-binding (RRM/RBD/RNP motifs) family protein n=1 Tax=Tasmannia lanceolata TaxID=3420 RepID=UPI0040638C3F